MAGEPNLAVERVTGWPKPQASRIVLPPWNWRYDTKQLADQRLPSDADAGAELGSILQVPTVNVIGIYACDNTASPLTSLVAGAPNLVAAGAPLVQRAANGLLYKGRRTSKLAVESPTLGGAERFRAAVNGFGQVPAGTSRSFGIVWRHNVSSAVYYDLMGTCRSAPEIGWVFRAGDAGVAVALQTTVAAWTDPFVSVLSTGFTGGGWHCAIVAVDGTARTVTLFTDLGNSAPVAYVGDLNSAVGLFGLGWVVSGSISGQIAYAFGLDVLADAAMFARFWTHGSKPSMLTAYTRANTVHTACAASAVSGWGANQYATRYASTFAARRNWRLEGVANDGPVTFDPVGGNNMVAEFAGAGGTAAVAADGPSGMRDSLRVTQGGAWGVGAFGRLRGAAVVGASNTPWYVGGWYRRATVGTTAQMGMYFSGDPGGAEFFTTFTSAATPTQWARGGGTCTPARPAHTLAYPLFGATNNADNCDWGAVYQVHNCSVALDWWVLTGIVAGVAQNPATITVSNAADAVLDHAQGSLRIRTAGFGGADTWDVIPVLFTAYGGGPGEIIVYRQAPNTLVCRLRDAAGAVVGSWSIAAASVYDGNEHLIQLDWCAASPVAYIAGVAWYAALYIDGALQAVGGGAAPIAPWVPFVGGTLWVNGYDGATYPGRAAVEEVVIFPNPSRLLGSAPVVL